MTKCIICNKKGIKEKYPYRKGYICHKCRFLKEEHTISLIGGVNLREKLSDLEHKQWSHWSKTISDDFDQIKWNLVNDNQSDAIKICIKRLSKWEKCWKKYYLLDEATKDYDRIWADRAIKIFIEYLEVIKRGIESATGSDNQFDMGYLEAIETLLQNLKKEIK